VDAVFKNSHKGERFSDAELQEAFETSNVEEVCKIIATKGEVQTNTSDRQKAMDEKRAAVVNYIAKYYIDPKTKKPHTLLNIQNALEAAKIRIDVDAPVDEQVKKAYSKLLEFIKLKRSEIEGKLSIPHKVLGQSQAVVRKYCQINKEDYTNDGVEMRVALVPGDFDTFMKELAGVTKGDFQFDVDGQVPVAEAGEANSKNKKKGGGKKKK
jgi:rRNA metabolism SBDS family protein